MDSHQQGKYTAAGTDIEEVKRQNANSGLSYNEIKEMIANKGKQGTATNPVRENIQRNIQS